MSSDTSKTRSGKRLSGWNNKKKSYTCKAIIIKYVVQDIPTYSKRCFSFLKNLCNDIDKLIQSYWLDPKEKEKRIHWIKGETLIQKCLKTKHFPNFSLLETNCKPNELPMKKY